MLSPTNDAEKIREASRSFHRFQCNLQPGLCCTGVDKFGPAIGSGDCSHRGYPDPGRFRQSGHGVHQSRCDLGECYAFSVPGHYCVFDDRVATGLKLRAYVHNCTAIGWHGGTFNELTGDGAIYLEK